MPIIVFNLMTDGNIARVVRGERIGTIVLVRPAADDPPTRPPARSEEYR